jgi:hypothetical protein
VGLGFQQLAALSTSAADEVNDFQLIAFVEWGLGPAISWHNVTIQFNGYAVRLHAEDFHKRLKCESSSRLLDLALFPIDLQLH